MFRAPGMRMTEMRMTEMRVTDLLSSTVVDESGHSLGRVHDVRVVRDVPGRSLAMDTPGGFHIAGLVVGGGRLVHAWGFSEGRATGPWLLRKFTARAAGRARFVPAERVNDWGPGVVRIHGPGRALPPLLELLQRAKR